MQRTGKTCAYLAIATLGLTLAMAVQSTAEASTATRVKIQTLRINLNPNNNSPRVSILVGPHGSPCSTAEWFAFDNATTGVGSLWASALDQSLVHNRRVTIVGTGSCDAFGVEGVNFIDFF